MDIILHDGKMWSDVKRVESQLYQMICEVRLGMYVRGVSHCGPHAEADHHLLIVLLI